MTHTGMSQHNVTNIKITKTSQLSGGTHTREIIIEDSDGHELEINVFAEDGAEDIEATVE